MAYASQSGRARTSSSSPQAHAICDRCGGRFNHVDLSFQYDWAGAAMMKKNIMVCRSCMDRAQPQLRAIVLPADPPPIMNPRPENFVNASTDFRVTSGLNTVNAKTGIPVPGGDRRSLSISPAGRSFAAGPRAESSDSAFIFHPKGVTRAFPSNVIAWRESRDRAQLSRSREEQGEMFIFCSLCSLLFW